MAGRRALVLAGGDLAVAGPCRHLLDGPWDWMIAADSGARHARRLGAAPTMIVGDFDSLAPHEDAAWRGVSRRSFPRDKDQTDTQLALNIACELGATDVVIAGGIGSRFDHSLANAHLLVNLHRRGVRGIVTDGRQAVYLLADRLELDGQPGAALTVLPLAERCLGLRLEGLRWELAGHDLVLGDTLTVSNEFLSGKATLSLREGLALVIVAPPE